MVGNSGSVDQQTLFHYSVCVGGLVMINVDVKVWVIQLYYDCHELLMLDRSILVPVRGNGIWHIYKGDYNVDDNYADRQSIISLRYYLYKVLIYDVNKKKVLCTK